MPFVAHRESFRIVAAATAHFAHDIHVGKKIHFDASQAVALASLAAAALHIKTKTSGFVTALARVWKHGKKIADWRENACIRCGIRTGSSANGRLVDLDDLVDLLGAKDFAMRGDGLHGTIEFLRQRAIKNVIDERGLSRAGNSSHHG